MQVAGETVGVDEPHQEECAEQEGTGDKTLGTSLGMDP